MLNLLDGWFKINLGDAAFYALLGFLFVFIGITLLILIFTLLGFIMKKVSANKDKKQSRKQSGKKDEQPETDFTPVAAREEVTPELVAVLTAAVAACLQEENSKCEFIVRRIKKL